jgi:hypothetical protein
MVVEIIAGLAGLIIGYMFGKRAGYAERCDEEEFSKIFENLKYCPLDHDYTDDCGECEMCQDENL